MDLEQFAKKTAVNFTKQKDLDHRIETATRLAMHYGISNPTLILFLTHPENARLTLAQRCDKLNITEEDYLFATTEPGFQKFMQEYRAVLQGNMQFQAIASASQALTTDRVTYSKSGEEIPNHQIEQEVIRGMSQQGTQVNVQVNTQNVWTEARKLARG